MVGTIISQPKVTGSNPMIISTFFFLNTNLVYIYFTLVTLTFAPQCKKNIVVKIFNFVNIRGTENQGRQKKRNAKPK